MKLKDIKNDGVWEKKEINHSRMASKSTAIAYNQAKAELSEVELVVDEDVLRRKLEAWGTISIKEQCIKIPLEDCDCFLKALASSMSEWLRLERGEG